MAAVYVRLINAGKMALENVPQRWRAEVEKILAEAK